MTSGIMSQTNQYERELIRQGVRDKKLELAQAGAHAGGGRAFGFEPSLKDANGATVPDKGNGITIRPSEAKLIQEAAAHVLAGGSLYAIAKDWDERGIPTVTGRRKWNAHIIGQILRRPRTAGLRQHQGEVIRKAVWPSIYELDLGIDLGVDPYKRVCAILNSPARRQPPQTRAYILRTILRCGGCGHDLKAMPRGGVQVYGCRKQGSDGCGKVYIKGEQAEEFVFSRIGPMADSPALRDVLAVEAGDDMAEVQKLVERIKADEDTKTELSRMFADREIDRANHNLQVQRINKRIAADTAKLATFRPTTILDKVGGVMADWKTYSTDVKREIILALVSSIDVLRYDPHAPRQFDPSRLVFHWRKPAMEQLAGRIFADRDEKEEYLESEWFQDFPGPEA